MAEVEIIKISPNDSMRQIVDKLNSMIHVVTNGVAVKMVQQENAATGQQEVMLNEAYQPDTHKLSVYVNGVKQRAAIDYREVDETTIAFFEPLLQGDILSLEWYVTNGDVLLGKVDLSGINQLPDGSIPYEKLSLPHEIITGDIDGGMFGDPRFQTGVDGGNFGALTDYAVDAGGLRHD